LAAAILESKLFGATGKAFNLTLRAIAKAFMDSNILYINLTALIRLRDKWGLYGQPVTPTQHKAVGLQLEELITFWLLDIYYTMHDYLKRNQITARITQRKFPTNVNRAEIKKEVLSRFQALDAYVKSSSGLLSLNTTDIIQAHDAAQNYFNNHATFLGNAALTDAEQHLIKLSSMIVEEDIL
jgi:hypothetical protein